MTSRAYDHLDCFGAGLMRVGKESCERSPTACFWLEHSSSRFGLDFGSYSSEVQASGSFPEEDDLPPRYDQIAFPLDYYFRELRIT
jgi:hypothetical protein